MLHSRFFLGSGLFGRCFRFYLLSPFTIFQIASYMRRNLICLYQFGKLVAEKFSTSRLVFNAHMIKSSAKINRSQ